MASHVSTSICQCFHLYLSWGQRSCSLESSLDGAGLASEVRSLQLSSLIWGAVLQVESCLQLLPKSVGHPLAILPSTIPQVLTQPFSETDNVPQPQPQVTPALLSLRVSWGVRAQRRWERSPRIPSRASLTHPEMHLSRTSTGPCTQPGPPSQDDLCSQLQRGQAHRR